MGIRWQFVENQSVDDASWSWRALHPDGTQRASPGPLPSYGAAVHDAIRHGFLPSEHDWSVTSGRSVVEYHVGATPPMVASRRPHRPARQPPSPARRPVSGGSAARRKR